MGRGHAGVTAYEQPNRSVTRTGDVQHVESSLNDLAQGPLISLFFFDTTGPPEKTQNKPSGTPVAAQQVNDNRSDRPYLTKQGRTQKTRQASAVQAENKPQHELAPRTGQPKRPSQNASATGAYPGMRGKGHSGGNCSLSKRLQQCPFYPTAGGVGQMNTFRLPASL